MLAQTRLNLIMPANRAGQTGVHAALAAFFALGMASSRFGSNCDPVRTAEEKKDAQMTFAGKIP